MWRSFLAFILMPSLMWSQNPPVTPTDQSQLAPTQTDAVSPQYQSFTQMQTVRRGTTERAAVLFSFGTDLVVSPRSRGGKVVPLKLEFAKEEGLSLISFEFPPDDRKPHTLQNDPVRLLCPDVVIHFKVKASRQAALGDRILKGKLTYQIVRGNEVLPSQVVDLQLPLTVVDHDSVTTKSPEYAHRFGDPAGEHHVLMWILMPILIPVVAVAILFCAVTKMGCMD